MRTAAKIYVGAVGLAGAAVLAAGPQWAVLYRDAAGTLLERRGGTL